MDQFYVMRRSVFEDHHYRRLPYFWQFLKSAIKVRTRRRSSERAVPHFFLTASSRAL